VKQGRTEQVTHTNYGIGTDGQKTTNNYLYLYRTRAKTNNYIAKENQSIDSKRIIRNNNQEQTNN